MHRDTLTPQHRAECDKILDRRCAACRGVLEPPGDVTIYRVLVDLFHDASWAEVPQQEIGVIPVMRECSRVLARFSFQELIHERPEVVNAPDVVCQHAPCYRVEKGIVLRSRNLRVSAMGELAHQSLMTAPLADKVMATSGVFADAIA
jgi:hypothetical protein